MSSGLLWLTAPSLGWEVKLWPGTCAQSKPQEQSSECPSTCWGAGVSLKTASLHLVCSFVLVAGHWEGCRLSTTGVCGQRVVTSSSDEARKWKYTYLGGMNHCMFRHCSPCVPSQQKMGRWKCTEWRTNLPAVVWQQASCPQRSSATHRHIWNFKTAWAMRANPLAWCFVVLEKEKKKWMLLRKQWGCLHD